MKITSFYPDSKPADYPHGINILASDGSTLFGLSLDENGALRIETGAFCKHGDVILAPQVNVKPVASNAVIIWRDQWSKKQ